MSFDFNQYYPDSEKSLAEMGFDGQELEALQSVLTVPCGLVVVAGISGSDTHETIHGCIRFASASDNLCVRKVGGAWDYPITVGNKESGADTSVSGFKQALLLALQSDPDLLVIGEARDPESARLVRHSVESGHKTLTTVHAASAFCIITRLGSLGYEPSSLNHFLEGSGLIYQSKLPELCGHCSIDFEQARARSGEWSEFQVERFQCFIQQDLLQKLRFRNHDGCPHCAAGAVGRTTVAEVVRLDAKLLQLLLKNNIIEAIAHHRELGGRTVFDNAVSKALSGVVDLRDVEHRLDVLAHRVVVEQEGFRLEYEYPPEYFVKVSPAL